MKHKGKVCTNCKKHKSYKAYNKQSKTYDGYTSMCRDCYNKKYNSSHAKTGDYKKGYEEGLKDAVWYVKEFISKQGRLREAMNDGYTIEVYNTVKDWFNYLDVSNYFESNSDRGKKYFRNDKYEDLRTQQ